jgi:hypothetical protein
MTRKSLSLAEFQARFPGEATWCADLLLKMRRSMVDPDRTKLAGIVEIDQTEVPFRTKARLTPITLQCSVRPVSSEGVHH